MKRKLSQSKDNYFIQIAKNIVYPIIGLCFIIALWAIISTLKAKPLVFPKPDSVIIDLFNLCFVSNFWVSVGMTLLRTLICFILSFAIAILFAIISGISNVFCKIITPIISILRSAPTMAIILIAMLWLDGQKAPILIGFLIAFPVLYQNFYTAICGVDKKLIEMSKVYKVNTLNIVRYLYIPEMAPAIFDASASTISLTVKVIIAAEVMAYSTKSLGLFMQGAYQEFNVSLLLAWTILAVMLSVILELIVKGLKLLWRKTL